MTVTFFGHGKECYSLDTKNKLKKEIESLIESGADEFLFGGYGNFDILAANVVKELKIKYPYIKSMLVIPYLNRKYNTDIYDGTLYPDIEGIFPKAAILERNKWMVKNSDIIVCYVHYCVGGAYTAVQYAVKKNKVLINIAKYTL